MSNGSYGSNSPATIGEYFARLEEALAEHFPSDLNPGEDTDPVFRGDYVSRDNKRRVIFFVSQGPRTVTCVTYGLPVSEEAAPLFKLEGLQPDTEATFFEMTVPAGQRMEAFVTAYVAGHNLVSWPAEIQRVRAVAAGAPGKLQRLSHNVQLYWSQMRARLHTTIRNVSIHIPRGTEAASSASAASDSERNPQSMRTSSASSGSVRGSAGRSSSRRISSRRSTSVRATSGRSSHRRSTRKSTSDPK
jgi:hypothetical protein